MTQPHRPSSETSIALDKRRIRQQVRAALAAMDDGDAAEKSALACEHILAAPFFFAARVIMAFDPMLGGGSGGGAGAADGDSAGRGGCREPDIRPVLEQCLALGKRLCIPRMDWTTRQMTPVAITNLDRDLVPAAPPGRSAPLAGQLREPRADLPAVSITDLDAILVPGLAFDHVGHRLGRGAGFYDRFLADEVLISAGAVTCGVAFALSVLPSVPHTPSDVPVDAIATEHGILSAEA